MNDKAAKKIAEVEGKLKCSAFAISTTIRSGGRDSFISLTFSDQDWSLDQLPLAVLTAARKLARVSLLDAVSKGVITNDERKLMSETQEKNYDRVLEALAEKHGDHA